MHKTTIISAILCLPSLIIALPAAAPNEIVRRSGTSVATVLSNLSVMKPTLNCLSTLTAQNSSLSSRDENSTANTAASGSTNTASSMDHSTHHDDKTSNGYTIPTALTTLQGQVDNTTTAVMGCSTFNAADSSMVMGGLDDVVPGFRSFLTNLMNQYGYYKLDDTPSQGIIGDLEDAVDNLFDALDGKVDPSSLGQVSNTQQNLRSMFNKALKGDNGSN